MSDISKLNINGAIYDIKDTTARAKAAEALAEHDKLLNKTETGKQTVNGQVQFQSGLGIGTDANGATITIADDVITFE